MDRRRNKIIDIPNIKIYVSHERNYNEGNFCENIILKEDRRIDMNKSQNAKSNSNHKKSINTELINYNNLKNIIIITGELAAGKTSYGKKISEELGIPFFSKDEIKELLYDSLNYTNIDYEAKRKLGTTSYSIFYYIMEEQLKVGKPLIVESNFVKESVPIIKKLLKKYNYKSITIRFEGDLKVLHKRFLEREYSTERHIGLVANGVFDEFKNFEQTAIKSKEFKIDDNEILVDTTDFSKVDFDEIIHNILNRLS